MSQRWSLRFWIAVVVTNSIVCLLAPSALALRISSGEADIDALGLAVAAIAVSLAIIQIAGFWLILQPRIRAERRDCHAADRVAGILEAGGPAIAYQPVFDLGTGQVRAVEALARFPDHHERSPEQWFAVAERIGVAKELELQAIEVALRGADSLPRDYAVAVNASPAMLEDPRLIEALHRSPVALDRVILELTEHTSIADYAVVRAVRERLRELGVRLAVDDAGSGYASMRHIVALAPDVIKIDRSLVTGIDHDAGRRALVSAVVFFAMESGAKVIGEGVETAGELDTLVTLGVDEAQGYFLGAPSPDPVVQAGWRDQNCFTSLGRGRDLIGPVPQPR
jgi:EAL domain-containing protein (putative c-di-GMP-specific phosphodiesterase class I)